MTKEPQSLVRIIKSWDFPDLRHQLPLNQDTWDGVRFIIDEPGECDYCIVLNNPVADVVVTCPPQHLWSIIQEPPIAWWKPYHKGHSLLAKTFTTDHTLIKNNYIHSQPALPWHVNKSYDDLMNCGVCQKEKDLSFITSNIANLQGHYKRLAFLKKIQGKLDFDLYGKGFNPIKDKWDGLAPYKYSIAIENYSGLDYWSEKLADCYLAWAMPIYYGCTNIFEYFPRESMIYVDINNPNAIEVIQQSIRDKVWEKNLDAIAEARKRILNQYQLFPFIANQIRTHENNCNHHQNVTTKIPVFLRPPLTLKERFIKVTKNIRTKLPLGTKIRGILNKINAGWDR